MANHGVITTGRTVAAAFDDLYYLERACQNQVLAMATGRPLKRVPAAEVERTRAEFDLYEEQADLHFTALKRMLAERNPTTRREARSPGDELDCPSERASWRQRVCLRPCPALGSAGLGEKKRRVRARGTP